MTVSVRQFVLGLGLALAIAGTALAQDRAGGPLPLATVDGSGSITATNTFQQVFAAATPTSTGSPGVRYRAGCLITNTSTSTQWVFFGALTSATTATSIPLNPATAVGQRGGTATCTEGAVGVIQQQISITGTAGGTFAAKQE